MGMLQPFQDCGAIIREIAGQVKRILYKILTFPKCSFGISKKKIRCVFDGSAARLKVSVDSRYRDRIAKSGSIMLCELQGAAEDFMFRWDIIFQNYPDVLTNETSREEVSALIDRMTTYLNTVKEM